MNEIKVGSLFSGIGGIEIAFEKSGFETEWFIENEPYAQTILKKRFPNALIYGDVEKVNFEEVPRVDILTGGFPCQDISCAGKRVGIEGSRSSLWKYYAKAIGILRPRFAFIENVSELTIRGLNVVLADLAKIGYDAEWYNLSASSVGAFHQRERIFIIAYPHLNRKPNEPINGEQGQRFLGEVSTSDVENSKCNRTNEGGRKENGRGEKSIKYPNIPQCTSEGDRGWWSVEPELGRVADGIPNRVDRIKCLGNSVVPQCAEVFAEAIKMNYSFEQGGEQ